MIAMDIMTDLNNDLLIVDGDFVIGESDMQHIHHILIAEQGDYKESPIIGIGIEKYINSTVDPVTIGSFINTATKHLKYDGFTNIEIDMKDFKNTEINADRGV